MRLEVKPSRRALLSFAIIRGWCMVPLNASPKRALALARQSMNRSSCNVNYSSGGTVRKFDRHWVKIRNFKDLVLVLYPPTLFGISLWLSLPIPFKWFSVIYCHTLSRPNHGPLFNYLFFYSSPFPDGSLHCTLLCFLFPFFYKKIEYLFDDQRARTDLYCQVPETKGICLRILHPFFFGRACIERCSRRISGCS